MDKPSIVRFAVEGEKFEILVKPDHALEFKLGKKKDVSTILISEEVYSDSNKGTRASTEKLMKAFKTTDQRRKMVSEKRKQIVEFIAKNFVDPRSHLPHPPLRIEQAMDDARVSIDPFKYVDEQIKEIVEQLRSIIPLKSENMLLEILVPAQFAAQSYSVLKSVGSLKKEEWQANGSLKVILDIPAAARANVIDRLGSITKGSASVEVAK